MQMEILSTILVVGALVFAWHVGRSQGTSEQEQRERERYEELNERLVNFFCKSDYLASPSLPYTKSMPYWGGNARIGPLSLVRTVDLIDLAIRAETAPLDAMGFSDSEITHHRQEMARAIVEQFLELSPELADYADFIRARVLVEPSPVADDMDDEEEEPVCDNCDDTGEVDCPLGRINYGGNPCPSDCPACHGNQRVPCLDCQEQED
ncbi:hypothetical protein D9M71_415970 [compost metagenome]